MEDWDTTVRHGESPFYFEKEGVNVPINYSLGGRVTLDCLVCYETEDYSFPVEMADVIIPVIHGLPIEETNTITREVYAACIGKTVWCVSSRVAILAKILEVGKYAVRIEYKGKEYSVIPAIAIPIVPEMYSFSVML